MTEPFFRVEMLPARHGDCLWLEYGDGGEIHRVLIDGGPVSTFKFIEQRLLQVEPGGRGFELVVCTHVDADHIEGLLRLFSEKPLRFAPERVWFNGWRQMKKAHGLLGSNHGEFLSALLSRRVTSTVWDFDGPPVVVEAGKDLPEARLPGGMTLTILSPTPEKLDIMAKEWEKTIKPHGIKPGDLDAAFKLLSEKKKFLPKDGLLGAAPDLDELLKAQFSPDEAEANGSSIAFLAEFRDKSALFLADAHPEVVAASLRRLLKKRGKSKLKVGAVKVAHHGSQHNTSDDLLTLIESESYLISSNGDLFDHPDPECLARILNTGKAKKLYFNYHTDHTETWIADASQKAHGYEAFARKPAEVSLLVKL